MVLTAIICTQKYDGQNCHYLHSAFNGGCCGVSPKTAILFIVAAGYMAVLVSAIRVKYGSHNRHFILQIIVIFNNFFCSVTQVLMRCVGINGSNRFLEHVIGMQGVTPKSFTF